MNYSIRLLFCMMVALIGGTGGSFGSTGADVRADTLLTDKEFFDALDLQRPGLEKVAAALHEDDFQAAKQSLCDYFRHREGRYWKRDAYEPVDDRAGQKSVAAYQRIQGRESSFSPDLWLADGTFNWKKLSGRSMLHRMYFFSALGTAYQYSKDEEVARLWIGLYRSWIGQMPKKPKTNTWATMNVGIRLRTGWGDAFVRFVNSPSFDDDSMFLFLKSFYEQAHYLRENHSRTSNWLTFEMAGLFAAGTLFPEFKDAADWREHAAKTALADLDAGWLPDGMSIELTAGYGQFFSNYLYMYDFSREAGTESAELESLAARCERLFTPYVQLMSPDRLTPAFSDNNAVDVPAFLGSAVERFPQRSDFRWVVSHGAEGEPPDYTSTVFPYAGYLIARSGWERDANYFAFDAGPVGYRHAHQDKLGVVLWAYGRQILFDPGRQNYDDTNPYQHYCMDTFSHSTGLVDNRPQRRKWYQNPHPDRRPYQKAEGFLYEIGDGTAWGSGVYAGAYGRRGSKGTDSYPYKKNGNFNERWCRPARHERQVVYFAPDVFVVQDRFVPTDSSSHLYEIRWQLNSVKTEQQDLQVQTADQYLPNLAVVPLWTDGLTVEVASAQDDPEILGWKVTDRERPATTLRHCRRGEGEVGFLTLLLPLKPGVNSDFVAAEQKGDGVVLRFADGRKVWVKPGVSADDRIVLCEEIKDKGVE